MKNWVAFLLIAIGTGFGQEPTHRPDGSRPIPKDLACAAGYWYNGTQHIWECLPQKIADFLSGIPRDDESFFSDIPASALHWRTWDSVSEQSVDVPAIPAFTKDQLRIRADAGLSGEQQWNCADENRALLTSVNGKRHSCHRIEP